MARAGPNRDAGHARPAGGGGDPLLRRLGGGRSAVHAAHHARAAADHAVQRGAERHPDHADPAQRGARAVRPHRGAVRAAVCRGGNAGRQGDGPCGASLCQRRAAPHRMVRTRAGAHGREAGHAVLAGAADHGLVSGSHRMNWGAMSRAERDAAYNNSAAVPNSPALNAAREAESAAFRSAHAGHLDLRYGPRERNAWDLFPTADPDAPCVVFIHGGYWQRNSKDQFANLIAGPYAHGWAAALPGYTLAPDASLSEIVAEII